MNYRAIEAVIKGVVPVVQDYVRRALDGHGERLSAIEGQLTQFRTPDQVTVRAGSFASSGEGVIGPAGEKGDPGERGEKGDAGDIGPRGEKGEPGESGSNGEPGPPGKDGESGRDGADGVGIAMAAVNDDGNLTLTLTTGEERNVGRVVGRDGADGRDGKDGEPGQQGPEGEKGDPGLLGERGEKGDPGDSGPPGETGERGEKGEPGDRGEPGPVGAIGEKGEPGPPGRDGMPGERGEKGDSGNAGRDGDPGPSGKDGRDGRDGKDGLTAEELEERIARQTGDVIAQALGDISLEGRSLRIAGQEFQLGIPLYRGVYRGDEKYVRGDLVTSGGSLWHCNRATRDRPGDASDDWQLAAKKGRDGKREASS